MAVAGRPARASLVAPNVVAGKSALAFRTIAEVARDLDLPTHVLRFWETKFPQIRPVKRRGGRRYYRPEDVALIERIRVLLHNEGYTIRGVQKLLREGVGGERTVAAPIAATPPPDEAPEMARTTPPAAPPPAVDWRGELVAIVVDLERLRDRLTGEDGS